MLGDAYAAKSMWPEAIAEYERGMDLGNVASVRRLGRAYAAGERTEEALNLVQRLEGQDPVNSTALALAFLGLGEMDRTFQLLEISVGEAPWHLRTLKVDPIYDPLRSDPRFGDLLRRMNLLEE